MLDLIGAITLVAAIAVNLNATITTMPLSSAQRLTAVAIAGSWIGLAVALGSTGLYAVTSTPVPAIGVMAALPVVAAVVGAMSFAGVREALLALPVPLLVGLNIMRIFGAYFLLLAAQDRLSGPFPQSAGWGDIIVGLTAIPLTIAMARNSRAQDGALFDLEFVRRARPDGRSDARNHVRAGLAAADVRRNDRLDRSHDAAMVEHSDPAGAVLPAHPRHHLRQTAAGQPGGCGLAGSADAAVALRPCRDWSGL